ncbi:MAG TPA: enoyl-CoA hydratase-related protein [Acidimicrobiales bacterium]|nr:enoyl-CoA hydratase-related protein [Acidimicrobiales bacterium]
MPATHEEFETLLYANRGDGLARLTLNRPEAMNGMTNLMVREATRALEAAAADRTVRVLVLTGEGRAFCPGADLKHFTSAGTGGPTGTGGPAGAGERLEPADFRVTTLLHEMPAVTVAAVNGACAGAGLGWALACDLRVMAAGARLNTAFLDVAVAGDMGLPWSLPRVVGAARARDLSFLPRRVGAEEALQIGLVARVYPDGTFRADTEELLAGLLAKSPTALTALKQNYVAAERMGFADFVDYEATRHLAIASSPDTAEAFRAFVEKRPPDFPSRRA